MRICFFTPLTRVIIYTRAHNTILRASVYYAFPAREGGHSEGNTWINLQPNGRGKIQKKNAKTILHIVFPYSNTVGIYIRDPEKGGKKTPGHTVNTVGFCTSVRRKLKSYIIPSFCPQTPSHSTASRVGATPRYAAADHSSTMLPRGRPQSHLNIGSFECITLK